MCCRLYCNIFNILNIYYLVAVMEFTTFEEITSKTPVQVAIIPFTLYITSTLTSFSLDYVYAKIGRNKTFYIGTVLVAASATSLLSMDSTNKNFIYVVAVMCGMAQAICLNTAISYVSEVVGSNSKSGAFVFRAYGLTDRCSTGIATMLISQSVYFKTKAFTQHMIGIFPTAAIALAFIFVITGKAKDYKTSNKKTSKNSEDNKIEDELV